MFVTIISSAMVIVGLTIVLIFVGASLLPNYKTYANMERDVQLAMLVMFIGAIAVKYVWGV